MRSDGHRTESRNGLNKKKKEEPQVVETEKSNLALPLRKYVILLTLSSGWERDEVEMLIYKSTYDQARLDELNGLLSSATDWTDERRSREMHTLHEQYPNIRQELVIFMENYGEVEDVDTAESEAWYVEKSEAEKAACLVNEQLKKRGLCAQAKVRQSWLYDHTSPWPNDWYVEISIVKAERIEAESLLDLVPKPTKEAQTKKRADKI